MWEAVAEYKDGSSYHGYFESSATGYSTEQDEQFKLESMLIERHPDCTWYSVNWIDE